MKAPPSCKGKRGHLFRLQRLFQSAVLRQLFQPDGGPQDQTRVRGGDIAGTVHIPVGQAPGGDPLQTDGGPQQQPRVVRPHAVGAVLLGVYILFFEPKVEKRLAAQKAEAASQTEAKTSAAEGTTPSSPSPTAR